MNGRCSGLNRTKYDICTNHDWGHMEGSVCQNNQAMGHAQTVCVHEPWTIVSAVTGLRVFVPYILCTYNRVADRLEWTNGEHHENFKEVLSETFEAGWERVLAKGFWQRNANRQSYTLKPHAILAEDYV